MGSTFYYTYVLSLYRSISFFSGSTRKKGNDTLGYYSGDLKQLLILVQLSCRKVIATEDAFPCPLQFSSTVERMFEQQMQQSLQRKSAFMPDRGQGHSRVKADAGFRFGGAGRDEQWDEMLGEYLEA